MPSVAWRGVRYMGLVDGMLGIEASGCKPVSWLQLVTLGQRLLRDLSEACLFLEIYTPFSSTWVLPRSASSNGWYLKMAPLHSLTFYNICNGLGDILQRSFCVQVKCPKVLQWYPLGALTVS